MSKTTMVRFFMEKVKNGYVARFNVEPESSFSSCPDEFVAITKTDLRKVVIEEVTRRVDDQLLSEKLD